MRCPGICCSSSSSSSSSSSPLLSLVTSTSEISHQPVHTYTTYIQYDKGVDRTGRQGIEEKIQHNMRKGRRKKKKNPDYAPWGVQCENRKNTSATKAHNQYTIDTRLCNRGGNPAPASSHPVLQPILALVTDPLVRLAVQSDGGEGSGVGR